MLQFLLIPTISFCLCKKRGWGKCGWVSANGQTNTWGKTDHRTLTHSWALCTFCRHHRAAAAVSLSHIYSQIGQKLFPSFPDPPCRPVWSAGCGETVLAKATFPGHHHHQGDSISLLTSDIIATVEHICKMLLPRMGTHPHTSQQNVAPLASCKNCSNLTRTSSPRAGWFLWFLLQWILWQTLL